MKTFIWHTGYFDHEFCVAVVETKEKAIELLSKKQWDIFINRADYELYKLHYGMQVNCFINALKDTEPTVIDYLDGAIIEHVNE